MQSAYVYWTPGQAKLRVWTKAKSTFGGVNTSEISALGNSQ
jgi:hypothetical protein